MRPVFALLAFSGVLAAVDTTPPLTPILVDGKVYTTVTTEFKVTVKAADPETPALACDIQLRADSTGGALIAQLALACGASTAVTIPSLALQHNRRYFAGARACHPSTTTCSAWGWSDGALVDTTPPSPVAVSDGGATTPSTTTLSASWTSSTDAESGLKMYQYSIRQDSPTGPLVLGFTNAGTATQVTRSGLTLLPSKLYFFGVRAVNGSGLFSPVAFSDGIRVEGTDTLPPVISGVTVSSITVVSAVVALTTNELSAVRIDYGLTSAYGKSVSSTVDGTSHRLTLTGLQGLSDFHFRIRATDQAGNPSVTADQVFRTARPGASTVSTSGRLITRRWRKLDNTLAAAENLTLRCVNWSPASRDTNTWKGDPNNNNVRRPEFYKWFRTDIPLLAGMNVNCVRVYMDPGVDSTLGPKGLEVLDELYKAGIGVIMTADGSIGDLDRVRAVIPYYKNHPAVILWSIGNEIPYNRFYGALPTVDAAMARVEEAAALIRTLDANHPPVASLGDIDASTSNWVNTVCPSVRVWSFNLYRGQTFGTFWSQWAAISGKPMFLGEWGIDAYDARINAVNDQMQMDWTTSQWNDIFRNLVTRDSTKVGSGGAFFQFSSEWWKVSPAGQEDPGGWTSGAFPDGRGDEEFFRTVTIDRGTTPVYWEMKRLLDPLYQPSRNSVFVSKSRGAAAEEYAYQYGNAKFLQDGVTLYSKNGGAGGGRGFNLYAVNLTTGTVLDPGTNFDTFSSRHTGTAINAFVDKINSFPTGTLVLVSVADEAGINLDVSCSRFSYTWTERGVAALEALGARQIRSVCFRDSYALAAVKGESTARGEQRAAAAEAVAQTTVTLP